MITGGPSRPLIDNGTQFSKIFAALKSDKSVKANDVKRLAQQFYGAKPPDKKSKRLTEFGNITLVNWIWRACENDGWSDTGITFDDPGPAQTLK